MGLTLGGRLKRGGRKKIGTLVLLNRHGRGTRVPYLKEKKKGVPKRGVQRRKGRAFRSKKPVSFGGAVQDRRKRKRIGGHVRRGGGRFVWLLLPSGRGKTDAEGRGNGTLH